MHKNHFVSGFMLGAAIGMTGGFMLHKNKRKIKAKLYYLKIRADIEQQVQGLKKFSREDYSKIIEDVLDTYRDKFAISVAELDLLKIELKSQWREAKQRFEMALEEGLEEAEEDEDED